MNLGIKINKFKGEQRYIRPSNYPIIDLSAKNLIF